MGRSVSTPYAATLVAHAWFDEEDDFDMVLDDYRDHLRHLFPSIGGANFWMGREDHVVGENDHATFGLSEYCGLVAYWAVPKSDLGAAWLRQIAPRFNAAFNQLEKLGTASNGETFYRSVK